MKNKKIIITIIIIVVVVLRIVHFNEWLKQRHSVTPLERAFNVGYKIYDFSYSLEDGTIKTLTTAIWYPTSDIPKQYDYNRILVSGNVAVNGKVDETGSPYPLVIFSHGYLGCGVQSVYFTKYLANQGYIVAAPDHKDSSICSIKGGRKKLPKTDENGTAIENFPNRPTDIKAVIDEMLLLNKNKESIFYQAIDENKIGVSGHSLGGWNAQVVSGAEQRYKDNRIKAALLLAPNTNQIRPWDFKKINIPVMYILGEKDHDHFYGDKDVQRRVGYDNADPPKFLPIVEGANHFSFADSPTCLIDRTVENCQNFNTKARVILKYGLAFLDRYLKNNLEAEQQLKIKDPRLKTYEYEFTKKAGG
jgi:predicted dienelactone hydrolase